jgi:ribonuclease P protein component
LAILTLKRRSDFQRVRDGRRWSGPAFVVEAKARAADCPVADARFGFTVSRRCGGAVERNRIRRRLRAAVTDLATGHANPNYDYVLIARRAALDRPFTVLRTELIAAFERVNTRANPRHKA